MTQGCTNCTPSGAGTLDRLKRVFSVIMPGVSLDRVDMGTRLDADLGVDSISLLLLVIAVEEEFGLRFEKVGKDDFVTVGDVCGYIEGKVK